MKKLFKFLFGQKEVARPQFVKEDLQPIDEVLRADQRQKIVNYYRDHKDHVDYMIKHTDLAYEPSQAEDKNDPRIWKAEHWNWFFNAED